ncbi:MAG: mycofactocin biosynthesis chaperone MftB [Desulfobacca sp.]|uniref:mycofactocin biosynthesis chaperone MftB n=1 Tax=Desulfobacca sp. TaxID=2067990 RepID=UPI004049F3DE
MSPGKRYVLPIGVQVRQEKFGLLFYNYRGPRLYFVPSGDFLSCSFFNGQQTVQDWAAGVAARTGVCQQRLLIRIQALLDLLEAKGLVHGQSIC